jgi:hypothetical protein
MHWVRPMGAGVVLALALAALAALAQEAKKRGQTSYTPVDSKESLASVVARMKADKPKVMKRHVTLLNERYDLSSRPAKGVTMSRGKPIQEGVRVKLPKGVTWASLAERARAGTEKNAFPGGFHACRTEPRRAWMLFLATHRRDQRAEGRPHPLDLDFDAPTTSARVPARSPDHQTRPGRRVPGKARDVDEPSRFSAILQQPGPGCLLRLRSSSSTRRRDWRSEAPSRGELPDCHVNGHTNGANHLVGDIRPQEFRHTTRLPLRGGTSGRSSPLQRALPASDFTEFTAPLRRRSSCATKKGERPRGSQVHFTAEVQKSTPRR